MRTRSRKIDTPSSSRGRASTTDPPQAPPLADVVATLMNVSSDNARILQALTQHVVPDLRGQLDPAADNTYRDFLKTHPPVFHKAKEPLEVED